jgi:hypothetical protein
MRDCNGIETTIGILVGRIDIGTFALFVELRVTCPHPPLVEPYPPPRSTQRDGIDTYLLADPTKQNEVIRAAGNKTRHTFWPEVGFLKWLVGG